MSSGGRARTGVRRVSALLIGALVTTLLPANVRGAARTARPPQELARVRYIHRGLTVQAPRGRPAHGRVKMPLYNQYLLHTGGGQKASLRFRDGTMLHLNQRTDAVLQNPHLTYVRQGEVDEVLSPGSNHRVQTGSAVAAAIGTQFDTRVSGKKTTIIVVEGAVRVSNARGSVVVKTNQETTVTPNRRPSAPVPVDGQAATSWTNPIPAPPSPLGINVGLDANGGQVIGYSSQQGPASAGKRAASQAPSPWDASYINDGRLDRGWASANGQTSNQWVKLRFWQGKTYGISAVVIDGQATGGHPAADQLRSFEIRVSTGGTDDASFRTVLRGLLKQGAGLQRFDLPAPVPATYVELYGIDNYGGSAIDVAELEVVSPQSKAPVPPPPPGATLTPIPAGTPVSTPVAGRTPTQSAGHPATPVVSTPGATNAPVSSGSRPTNTPVPSKQSQNGGYVTPAPSHTSSPTATPRPTETAVPGNPGPGPCPTSTDSSQQTTCVFVLRPIRANAKLVRRPNRQREERADICWRIETCPIVPLSEVME